MRLFACAKCFATRTVTRAKPQPRTRIVAMTIIQYFAALLAMGALLAYFVRARTERARRDAPPLTRTFSVHAACEGSSPSRPTFVRTPRAPRPHALTRRPRVPLTANAGPTHVQDRPDPDGARATRPDHPRPSLSVRRPRSRTRCQSGENVCLDQSGFSGKLPKPPPETIRRAHSSTFACEVVGRAERVCLSLFARVSASTTNRLTRSPFKYNHDPHDI